MEGVSKLLREPPPIVYQCRRTETNTLDSAFIRLHRRTASRNMMQTIRLGLQVLLSPKQQAAIQKLYRERTREPLAPKDAPGRPRTVKGAVLAEVLRDFMDIDILYYDYTVPAFFRAFDPEDDNCVEGKMSLVPKPSVELSVNISAQGLIDINILPRTLPISSTHQGRPFRLFISINNEEFIASAPFFVLAKEISKTSSQGHRPRGMSAKRWRSSFEDDEVLRRENRLLTALVEYVPTVDNFDFWLDLNRRLVGTLGSIIPLGVGGVEGGYEAPPPGHPGHGHPGGLPMHHMPPPHPSASAMHQYYEQQREGVMMRGEGEVASEGGDEYPGGGEPEEEIEEEEEEEGFGSGSEPVEGAAPTTTPQAVTDAMVQPDSPLVKRRRTEETLSAGDEAEVTGRSGETATTTVTLEGPPPLETAHVVATPIATPTATPPVPGAPRPAATHLHRSPGTPAVAATATASPALPALTSAHPLHPHLTAGAGAGMLPNGNKSLRNPPTVYRPTPMGSVAASSVHTRLSPNPNGMYHPERRPSPYMLPPSHHHHPLHHPSASGGGPGGMYGVVSGGDGSSPGYDLPHPAPMGEWGPYSPHGYPGEEYYPGESEGGHPGFLAEGGGGEGGYPDEYSRMPRVDHAGFSMSNYLTEDSQMYGYRGGPPHPRHGSPYERQTVYRGGGGPSYRYPSGPGPSYPPPGPGAPYRRSSAPPAPHLSPYHSHMPPHAQPHHGGGGGGGGGSYPSHQASLPSFGQLRATGPVHSAPYHPQMGASSPGPTAALSGHKRKMPGGCVVGPRGGIARPPQPPVSHPNPSHTTHTPHAPSSSSGLSTLAAVAQELNPPDSN